MFRAERERLAFAMFTEPDLLVRWLGDTTELDPVPGGLFRFTLADPWQEHPDHMMARLRQES